MEQTKSGYIDKTPNDDFSVGGKRVILRKAICCKINAMKVHIEEKEEERLRLLVISHNRQYFKVLPYITKPPIMSSALQK